MWVGIITGLLKLVSALAGIFATRQLLDAGEAKAIAAGAQRTLNAISKAQTIVVVALLLTMILASCSWSSSAPPRLDFCQLYEPLRLAPATKEFLATDDPLISADRKTMADNNRVWRCLCTTDLKGCEA